MSLSHLILLGIIAIIVIPPEKLPEVAKQAARFITDLRRMTSGLWDDLKQEAILKPEDLMKPNKPSNNTPTAHAGFESSSALPNQSNEPMNTIHKDANLSAVNSISKEPTLSPEQIAEAQRKAHEEYLKTIQVPEPEKSASTTANHPTDLTKKTT